MFPSIGGKNKHLLLSSVGDVGIFHLFPSIRHQEMSPMNLIRKPLGSCHARIYRCAGFNFLTETKNNSSTWVSHLTMIIARHLKISRWLFLSIFINKKHPKLPPICPQARSSTPLYAKDLVTNISLVPTPSISSTQSPSSQHSTNAMAPRSPACLELQDDTHRTRW